MSDDILFKKRYRIPSARLASWDYRWAGVYSVTLCSLDRVCWFGEIVDGEVTLSPEGRVVAEEWGKLPRIFPHVALDEWIVMPDHMHGILVFQHLPTPEKDPKKLGRLLARSLGALIGQFKSKVTKRIRRDLNRPQFDWQERFHDFIVRDSEDLERIRAYIRTNPVRWKPK
jgi:putative transposase